MFRTGKWIVAAALAVASVWAGFALTAQEPRPANPDAKAVDLTALRDALDTAARRGENVDDVRKALDAFEKAVPAIKPGGVPAELQALRDAVDAAARKGENVAAVEKELAVVETAVAGRSLAKPKPEPRPEPRPNPINPRVPFPAFPVPDLGGGGIDAAAFQKAMDLRTKALELMLNNPRDPAAQKMLAESNDLLLKALGNGQGGLGGLGGLGAMPGLLDVGRVPERARLGVRMEKLNAITAEQLGLDPNVGVAVASVVPGSAAEKAGLKANDIVLEFAGKPVSDNLDDFVRQVNAAKANEKFDIVVMRKGKKVSVKDVTLPDMTAAPRPAPRPLPAAPKPIIDAPDAAPAKPVPAPIIPAPVIDDAPALLRAEKPTAATPDLDDLRDAVTAADKRGANVGPIRDALTALEKAQAKGVSAQPGEAPPELTALRGAVEDALKKGESVDGIAKQLALVEKAITGREYERPKPPEPPKPEPVPPLPRRGFGGGGFGRAGGGIVINGGDGFNATSITVSNGDYTIKARQGDVTYTITGTQDGAAAPKIVIKDGDKTTETDDLKKVPEAHLPAVERLIKMVNRR